MRPLVVVLALGLGALARAAPAQVPQPQRLPPTLTIDTLNAVTVQNQRKVPVTVYLEVGAFDRRLGVVQPTDVATLPLPGWVVRGHPRVRLFVHPEGEARDLSTQVFSLRAPVRIAMVVPAWGEMPASVDTMTAVIPPEQLAEATVTVDNARAKAVTVFARQGRFDVRLGRVEAGGRATLRFPKSVILPGNGIELFVRPDGALDLSSQVLTIRRGQHIGLRVPAS
jgi:hypothetical protein